MPRITKATIAAREIDAKALELRKIGLSYDRIATALGISDRGTAWRHVNRALQSTVADNANDVRKIEGERLDALFAVAFRQALTGDLKAVETCLQIQARRARLFGLDAPTRTRVEVITEDAIDAAIRQLEAELGDRSATGEAPPVS